jgi:hypothetical protein
VLARHLDSLTGELSLTDEPAQPFRDLADAVGAGCLRQ